jgi:hypothetical protein
VTELDLRQSLIPAALIEHLATVMPKDTTGEGYDYHSFLDVLVNGTAGNGNGVKHSLADSESGTLIGERNWV